MKRTLILIAAMALNASLIAQASINNATLQAVPLKMEPHTFSNSVEHELDVVPMFRTNSMLSSNEFYHLIGETYYNLPTNCNSRNTIGFHSRSSTGAAVWTMAQSNPSRGTGINYYNANQKIWGAMPLSETGRIETVKTGWGAHGFTEAGEIVVAHDGASGLIVNTREVCGQGKWEQSTLFGPQYLISATPTGEGIPNTTILWPTIATNGNTVHLVCVTNTWPSGSKYPLDYEPNPNLPPYGYLGYPTLPIYYRSTDGGKTWEDPRDFREYGMTNFECFTVSSDQYTLAVKDNHVVLLYNNSFGYINYMESRDGGDTWVKKTVYDNGLAFTKVDELVEPRLVPTSSAIYIDENHKVHIVFSAHCFAKDAGSTSISYWANLPIGMVYWNDDRNPIDWQEIRGWREGNSLTKWNWEEYSGYITLPSVVGLDKYYMWKDGPMYNQNQFNDLGWALYPKILAKNGRVFVAYQSPLDYPFSYETGEGSVFSRGIFITVSEDYGKIWEVQNNTSWISYHPDLVWADWSNYTYPEYDEEGNPTFYDRTIIVDVLSENAYPSMSYNYKGDTFMLQWTNQLTPFSQANGLQYDPINVMTFTQELKNIPAHNNIKEVYKGLWNNTETGIDCPKSNNALNYNIYPNPASNELTISFAELAPSGAAVDNEKLTMKSVEIYDVCGKKQLSILNCQLSIEKINISHLPQGIYFVRIYSNDNQFITKKLVVAK